MSSNPVISANNLVVDQIPGFICNYSFDTSTPPYTILDPSDPYEAITRQFQIPANDVVKLVIGQVPYPIVNEQLANLMHAMTDVWPLSVGAHTVPGDTAEFLRTGARRRTGMWFVHIKKECADRFTDLDRRVVIRAHDAAVFEGESKHHLMKMCRALRDQAAAAGQPKSLLPMTVAIAAPRGGGSGGGRSKRDGQQHQQQQQQQQQYRDEFASNQYQQQQTPDDSMMGKPAYSGSPVVPEPPHPVSSDGTPFFPVEKGAQQMPAMVMPVCPDPIGIFP